MDDNFQRRITVLLIINFIISFAIVVILSYYILQDQVFENEGNPNIVLYGYGATLETQGQFIDVRQWYSVGVFLKNNGDANAIDLTVTFRIEGYSNNSLIYLKVDNTILDWELEPNTVVGTGPDINITSGVEVNFIQVICNWNTGSKAWNFWMDLEPNLSLEGEALFV